MISESFQKIKKQKRHKKHWGTISTLYN